MLMRDENLPPALFSVSSLPCTRNCRTKLLKMLSDAPDIAQLDLALSQTANSLTQHCPGQYTAEPSAVPECSAGLSAVPDSAAVLDSAQLDILLGHLALLYLILTLS